MEEDGLSEQSKIEYKLGDCVLNRCNRMKTIVNLNKLLMSLLAVLGSLSAEGQILHYRFTGTIEGGDPDVDFYTEDIVLSDMTVKIGDKVSGTVTVDPVGGRTIVGASWPTGNRLYLDAMSEYDLEINGIPFIRNEERTGMDVAAFNNATKRPSRYTSPLGNERADGVIFSSFVPVSRVGEELAAEDADQFIFLLNLTDTSARALRTASYPERIDLGDYDLAKGFILPAVPFTLTDYGAMFQIESFKLIETRVRPVIATGPESRIVSAGGSIRLAMTEVQGNEGVKRQWSLNGIDLPGEARSVLTVSDLQASDSGTYRVTAWNNLGTTNVARARIQVEGLSHRLLPLDLKGWNADLIVGEGEEPSGHAPFGEGSNRWFVAGFDDNEDGFPVSGQISSAADADVLYTLQPYDLENALWLTSGMEAASSHEPIETSPSGVLELVKPTKFTSLAIAASSSGGDGKGELVLHFADGSISSRIDYNASDWWTAPDRTGAKAISGLGRISGDPGQESYESPSNYGYGLYETVIDFVALGLADKTLASIEFHKASGGVSTGIFAVSAQSVELSTGVYVSWKADSEDLLFDVGASAGGPWTSVGRNIQAEGDRKLAVIQSKILPRFYRTRPQELERDLSAFYDFARAGREGLEGQMEMETSEEIEFPDQTMLIPEPGLIARTVIPQINYNRFTIGLEFLSLDIPQFGEQNIVTGGTGYRWFRLYTLDGQLAVSVGGDQEVHVFDDVSVRADQWHRLFLVVNTRTRRGEVYYDGTQLPPVELGDRFNYELSSSAASEFQRAPHFGTTENSAGFVGYVDNFMHFRTELSAEEIRRVDSGLKPKAFVSGIGPSPEGSGNFSVGFQVSWEANLQGFGLERAESPLGPWSSVEPLEATFNGRRISFMDTRGEIAIYRLRNLR